MHDLAAHNFAVELPVCVIRALRDRRERRQSAADEEWRKRHTDPGRRDPADGRSLIVRHLGRAKPSTTT